MYTDLYNSIRLKRFLNCIKIPVIEFNEIKYFVQEKIELRITKLQPGILPPQEKIKSNGEIKIPRKINVCVFVEGNEKIWK